MTDVRTQTVIDALTELGFERRTANDSHALYDHPAGASVSLPHSRPHVSSALLKAIERQVAGFGIAPAHLFGEKIHAPHRVAPLSDEAGDGSADTAGSGTAPARSAFDRETGGHKAASPPKSRRRRAAAQ
ncbi:hypothetical protein NS228_07065 [Methylobacterium indicum]|uniref:hypothetical protein n=1 Tax=Methylobacterium indicum TaxID=1775910 RepID=UPI000734F64F|nr:hypothetical protein [Methylobacterium indicum]KTS22161.1 hypothetical protein NS229_23160 [Methylobacterium indicum]KTS41312.1 hypothetical protein NS228_07065 [Methylobacterium indicum]KTS51258.1 hypothetical protein NS230_14645 [Methylobacterium indicum]